MSDQSSSIVVRDNTESRSYDAMIGDRIVGSVIYETVHEGGHTRIVFRSTIVEPELRDRGIGAVMVEAALDDVRAKGATLTNHCSFVEDFIAANPQYADLLDAVHPGRARSHRAG